MRTSPTPNSKPLAGGRKAAAKRAYSILDIEPEELEPAIEEVGTAIENNRRGMLKTCYEIGRAIDAHYRRLEQEHQGVNWPERGERYFKQLEEALGPSAAWLRNHFRLARTYNEDEFDELCQTPSMTATKALQLAGVDDKLRKKLVKRIGNESLTVQQVEAAIKEAVGFRRQPGAGRPPKRPKKLQDAFIHLTKQAEQVVRISNAVWFGNEYDIVAEIKESPMDQVNDKFKAQVIDAAVKLEELAATAAINAQKLRETLPEIDRRMAAQAEFNARRQAELEAEEQHAGAAA